MIGLTPKTSDNRSSNVYTINVPSQFKKSVLEKAQLFGGAGHLITLSLDDLALRVRKARNRLNLVEELNDYIKLEILLMRRYEVERKEGENIKLSFRLKDIISKNSLNVIKKKTGWQTSKTVRIALLWYLYANFDEFVASESFVNLLRCDHCGFVTHDQRALAVHIKTLHEAVCPYCGAHYMSTEYHSCPQQELTKVRIEPSQPIPDSLSDSPSLVDALSAIDSDETKLLEELGIKDIKLMEDESDDLADISDLIPDPSLFDDSDAQLEKIHEEISKVGGTLVDLPRGSEASEDEDKKKDKKAKKEKDSNLEKLQSEIGEMLLSLKDDGLLDE